MNRVRLLNVLFNKNKNRNKDSDKCNLLNNDYYSTSSKNQIINITSSAWDKISYIIKTHNIKKPRHTIESMLLSVDGGGCNGFKYNLSINKDINCNIDNYQYVENNNKRVYIDPMGEMYLIGTTIDYIKEDITNNIFESKFVFTPDKSIATNCGCGTSFSPK